MDEPAESRRVYCTACGEAIDAGDRFCAYCGEPVSRRGRRGSPSRQVDKSGRPSRRIDRHGHPSRQVDRHGDPSRQVDRHERRSDTPVRARERSPTSRPGVPRARSGAPTSRPETTPQQPGQRRHRSGSEPADRRESRLRAVGVAAGLGVLGVFVLGLALLVSAFVGVLVSLLVGLPFVLVVGLALVVAHFVGFVGVAVLYLNNRGYDAAGIRSYVGLRRPTGRELGLALAGNLGIVLVLGAFLGLVELFALVPDGEGTQQDELREFGLGAYAVAVAFMLLVVGPTEEVLYRGVVQNRLRERFEAVPAIAIASAVFTAIHLQIFLVGGGLVGIAVGFLALFIPSVVLGTLYEHTENVVVPSLVHGIHNSLIITALFFGPPFLADVLTF